MLVTFLEFLLNKLFAISNDYGIAIILLSITVNIIMLPLYWFGEILQKKEKKRQSEMREDLQLINEIKNRQEKYYYTKEIHRRHNYKLYYSLVGVIGLIIQIPFFIAAYNMLAHLDLLQGVSFGQIKNLAAPDALISIYSRQINILPLFMTFVNCVGIALQYREAKNKQEVIKLTSIALVFLLLLYNVSASLLLYWTVNNLFSVVKMLVLRNQHARNILGSLRLQDHLGRALHVIKLKSMSMGGGKTLFLLLALNVSLWLFLPLYIFGIYSDEFHDANISTYVNFLLVIMSGSIILSLILNKLVFIIIDRFISIDLKETYRGIFYGILLFLFSWISFAGYVFPVVKSTGGLIDNDHIALPLNWQNIIIVLFLSISFAWLGACKNRSSLIAFFFCAFYLSSIPSLINNLSGFSAKMDSVNINTQERDISELSNTKNILVVSFDGLQRSTVHDIFNTDTRIKAQFSDFTFFTNAASTEPATFMSLCSELFGNNDFHIYGETKNDLKKNLPLSDLLINKVSNDSINISLYGDYTTFSTKPENNYYISDPVESKIRFFSVFHFEFDRLLSGKIGFRLIRRIIHFIINPVLVKLNLVTSGSWNDDIEIKEYERWVNHLNVSERDTLSLKYLHFLHTHYPVRIDQNGVVRSSNKHWMESNQNETGTRNQTYFALSQFADLINKLKEIGAYDNCIIILKSDHGQPTTYYKKYPLNLKINNHQKWGYSRYEPLLMIKDLSSRKNVITEVPDLVTLGDLSSTVEASVYNKKVQVDFSKGLNLLSPFEKFRSPFIYINLVKDSASNFRFDTHRTHKLDRTESDTLINLLRSSGIELSN
jgi:YidC/Oxa1 family membrane protein insertase